LHRSGSGISQKKLPDRQQCIKECSNSNTQQEATVKIAPTSIANIDSDDFVLQRRNELSKKQFSTQYRKSHAALPACSSPLSGNLRDWASAARVLLHILISTLFKRTSRQQDLPPHSQSNNRMG